MQNTGEKKLANILDCDLKVDIRKKACLLDEKKKRSVYFLKS